MRVFFDNENISNAISGCIKKIISLSDKDDFEKEKKGFIVMILESMKTTTEDWDKCCQFNITHISPQLKALMIKSPESYEDIYSLDLLFAILFRFYSEYQLFQPEKDMDGYPALRQFAKDNASRFTEGASRQIFYTLEDMPTSILKNILSSSDFKSITRFIETKEKADQLKLEWDKEILEKEKNVTQLKETLDEYKTAFNFVSLYGGFSSLSDAKVKELTWARRFMLTLGVLIPVLIAFGLWHVVDAENRISTPYDLIYLIPGATLSLVFIYYFRVSLGNYNSIRAQIMQIELRKSLCQFIQDYAKYSKEINSDNAGLLNKFEEVIFSNIMINEDKIPSTFDGLEQIASFITAIKQKGK